MLLLVQITFDPLLIFCYDSSFSKIQPPNKRSSTTKLTHRD